MNIFICLIVIAVAFGISYTLIKTVHLYKKLMKSYDKLEQDISEENEELKALLKELEKLEKEKKDD